MHGGAVHFVEHVAGQVGDGVQVLHAPGEVGQRRPGFGLVGRGFGFGDGGQQGCGVGPGGAEVFVQFFGRAGGQGVGQLVRLVAGGADSGGARQDRVQGAEEGVVGGRREQAHGVGGQGAQGWGQGGDAVPDGGRPEVAVVAAEGLVPAVAGEADRDVVVGELGHHAGGELGGVGKGLVVHVGQPVHQVENVLRGDREFGVVRAQVVRDLFGVAGFVVGLGLEADGEGPDGLGGAGLHERGDQGGVDAAREQRAQGHVREHLVLDRVAEQSFQMVGGFGFGAGERVGESGGDGVFQGPVGVRTQVGGRIGADGEQVAGRQLERVLVDAARLGYVLVAQEQGQGAGVEFGGEVWQRAKGFEFRAEGQPVACAAVVEGLFAHAVAGQVQDAVLAVPEGEGEHAGEPGQGWFHAPGLERGQHDLGVRVPAPGRQVGDGLFQLPAQLEEVVDFAVVDEHVAARGGVHGLGSGLGQVEDGQPPVAEPEPGVGVGEHARVVRPAMGQGVCHAPGQGGELVAVAGQAGKDKAGYSAHLTGCLSAGRSFGQGPPASGRRAIL